jgi:hypothetical protein
MRRLIHLTIATTVSVGVLASAAPASAVPDDGANGNVETFAMSCNGEPSTITIGGGPWSAAHVAESGRTFVPVSTYVSMRDAVTLELLYEESDAKGKPRGGPDRCVDEVTVDGVLITFAVHGHLR